MPAVRDDYYETDGSYQKVGILRVISATRSDAGEAAISNSPQMDSESLPPGSAGRSETPKLLPPAARPVPYTVLAILCTESRQAEVLTRWDADVDD